MLHKQRPCMLYLLGKKLKGPTALENTMNVIKRDNARLEMIVFYVEEEKTKSFPVLQYYSNSGTDIMLCLMSRFFEKPLCVWKQWRLYQLNLRPSQVSIQVSIKCPSGLEWLPDAESQMDGFWIFSMFEGLINSYSKPSTCISNFWVKTCLLLYCLVQLLEVTFTLHIMSFIGGASPQSTDTCIQILNWALVVSCHEPHFTENCILMLLSLKIPTPKTKFNLVHTHLLCKSKYTALIYRVDLTDVKLEENVTCSTHCVSTRLITIIIQCHLFKKKV